MDVVHGRTLDAVRELLGERLEQRGLDVAVGVVHGEDVARGVVAVERDEVLGVDVGGDADDLLAAVVADGEELRAAEVLTVHRDHQDDGAVLARHRDLLVARALVEGAQEAELEGRVHRSVLQTGSTTP